MSMYQVQYKNASNTFTDNIEANSHIEIIDLFKDLINAEVTEIREILYTDTTYPKDDENDIKSVSCRLINDSTIYSFKIPKMKKTVTLHELEDFIKIYIKINNKSPKSLKITQNF